jgi:acyl-CoA reductase-like NAD-dependent aldehyde dehydrogenase
VNAALSLGRAIETKAFLINECTAFRVDWMPFGGAKASGLGTGGPHYAMREMTVEKLLILKQQHA